MKLSAIILTKNEEKNLSRCLESLQFVDELIIVDDESIDKTVDIAKQYGAAVYFRSMVNDFSSQRNYALEKATGDWLLFIDADEQLSTELQKEITKAVQRPVADAYYIKRRDYFWGRELKHGEISLVRHKGLLRLMKKGSGQWKGLVHETFITAKRTANLKGFLNHYPHLTITEFIQAVNNYSTLRALELYRAGKKDNMIELIVFPLAKFIYTYFFNLGFMDGPPGFVYSFFMSWHSFLVRAKLWQFRKLGLPQ